MVDFPEWLPPLICLSDYGGDWECYEEVLYALFRKDFIDSKPDLSRLQVEIAYNPLHKGKCFSFWHVTSEGSVENQRTPDFRRCERICWIRPMIENPDDPAIKIWDYREAPKKVRTYIWLKDFDYVVVLEKRSKAYFLVTAFCVSGNSTRSKLQRKYEQRLS